MLLQDRAAGEPLGDERSYERAERSGKRGELSEHQLEHTPVEPTDVGPALLPHAGHLGGQMCDGRPQLNELHP